MSVVAFAANMTTAITGYEHDLTDESSMQAARHDAPSQRVPGALVTSNPQSQRQLPLT